MHFESKNSTGVRLHSRLWIPSAHFAGTAPPSSVRPLQSMKRTPAALTGPPGAVGTRDCTQLGLSLAACHSRVPCHVSSLYLKTACARLSPLLTGCHRTRSPVSHPQPHPRPVLTTCLAPAYLVFFLSSSSKKMRASWKQDLSWGEGRNGEGEKNKQKSRIYFFLLM